MCLVFRCDDEKYDGSTRSLCQLVSCGDHMHVKFTGRSSIFAFTFGHNGAPTYKGGGWEREIYIYIWDMRSVLLLVLTMCFVFFHPEVLKKLSSFWCIYHLLFYCHHNPKLTWIEFSILYGHTMKCKGVPQIGLWWSCMELWRVRSCISEAPLEAIKKIRERELPCVERSYGRDTIYIKTTGHTRIKTLQPLAPFREAFMEIKLVSTHSHFLYRTHYTPITFLVPQ